MSKNKGLVAAVVQIADALDRLVFLLEAVAAEVGLVHPADVGFEEGGGDVPPEEEEDAPV